MTIANIINTIEYKMGSCALYALRHSKKYGKANLAILNNEYCEKYYFGFKATPKPIIKTATLKNDAGIIGAAYFALENLKDK